MDHIRVILRNYEMRQIVLTVRHLVSHTRDMTRIDQWVRDVTNGDSGRKIAKRSGIHPATLNRQLAENALTPEHVVRIARGYGASAVEGLLALGVLTHDDLTAASAAASLAAATDEQLMDEVLRRMKAGQADYDKPLSEIEMDLSFPHPPSETYMVTHTTRELISDERPALGMVADRQEEPIDADQDESRYEP